MEDVFGRQDPELMDVDPDEGCVYNADYAEAMAGMCGDDAGASDVEVVSLDDVIGGLDQKFLKGFLGKNASELKEVGDEIPEEGVAEPFMPFAAGKHGEPGSIFRSMQKASGEQTPDKPW